MRGGYNHDGLVFELAAQLGAIIVAPEHRFYGASLPFGPTDSYIPSNLAHLTVQVLSDALRPQILTSAAAAIVARLCSCPRHRETEVQAELQVESA